MYLGFYHLKERPFHITPDPDFLFLSPSHREAIASIIYGVEQRKGFILITGEVGTGKTTIIRSYLDRVDSQRLRTIYIFNANISFQGLLNAMYRDLDLSAGTDDISGMVDRLHHALVEEYRDDRNVVLIIDEAQNMPVETLENLRMISNIETSKDKLIQILLVGQPELERMLDLNELRQLRQRIAVRCKIAPLNKKESLAYVQHRMSKAAAKSDHIFTKSALRQILREAKGIPRTINILCDNALITGFGYQQKPISTKIAKEVITDFRGKKSCRSWMLSLTITILLALLSFTFWTSSLESWKKRLASLISTKGKSSMVINPVPPTNSTPGQRLQR